MNARERRPSEEASNATGPTGANGANGSDAEAGDELERLRQLLAAPERARLRSVEQRLEGRLVDVDSVAKVLPQAIRNSVESGDTLVRALTPAVQSALTESVRRDPSVLANALAPTIGAAIRKAIAAAIAGMLEGFNRTLDQSLSPRSVRWRVEAWRTQRPFAEVVMLRTLRYQVEQIFLIHRDTGLLLQHCVAPTVSSADPDLVSGMLSAIQSFVADSFAQDSDSQLEEVEFGDRRVVLARGSAAVLAAVLRGFPPPAWRKQLEETVERVHAEHAADLAQFRGDSAPFESDLAPLEELLVEQRAEPRRSRVVPIVAGVALVAALGLGVAWAVNAHSLSQAVQRARAAFEQEPGYVLVDARAADGGVKIVALRSPDARPPQAVLGAASLEAYRLDLRVVDVALAPESAPLSAPGSTRGSTR